MPRKADVGITLTDLFCGAGGSSEGAAQAGATPYLALNHWGRAIETHNTNFPDCLHDCTDVQASNPRRYPSTNILIASPECVNHSLAKGVKRQPYKTDLFGNPIIDPAAERSRATMWDVVRFAEYHRYELCIIENVVDAAKWELFDEWLSAMHKLGYQHEIVYFNSQFAFPTPQSRDRMYVVFWKKKNRKPNLNFMPPAPCLNCGEVVNALQTWKSHKRWGRYGAKRQYFYTCPKCRGEVTPFYYAAMNAIDWSITAERIGDRKKPLQPKTLERIKYGLEKYGRNPLIIKAHHGDGLGERVRDALSETMLTQATCRSRGIASPYFLQTTYTQANGSNVAGPEASTFTQTTRAALGIVAPALVDLSYTHSGAERSYGGNGAMPTQTGTQGLALLGFLSKQFSGEGHASGLEAPTGSHTTIDHHALVTIPPSFLTYSGRKGEPFGLAESLGTFTSIEHHALISPLMVSVNDFDSRTIPATHQSGGTQTTQDKWAIAAPSFIAEMHGQSKAGDIIESLMCITANAGHHALIRPDALHQYMNATGQPRDLVELQSMLNRLDVDDLTFRMLKPHEIQRGMAFPDTYTVLGNSTEKIKQLGNAVTPPVMKMLMQRAIESLEGTAA